MDIIMGILNDPNDFLITKYEDTYVFKVNDLVKIVRKDLNEIMFLRDNFINSINVYKCQFIRENPSNFIVEIFGKRKIFIKYPKRTRHIQEKTALRKFAFQRALNFLEKEKTNPENFSLPLLIYGRY